MGMGMAARGVGRACEQPQREPPRPELDRGARARGAAWVVSSIVGSNCEVCFRQVNIIVQAASCPRGLPPTDGGPF